MYTNSLNSLVSYKKKLKYKFKLSTESNGFIISILQLLTKMDENEVDDELNLTINKVWILHWFWEHTHDDKTKDSSIQ